MRETEGEEGLWVMRRCFFSLLEAERTREILFLSFVSSLKVFDEVKKKKKKKREKMEHREGGQSL